MIKILQLYFTILSFFFNYVQDKTFLLFYRKRKKKPNAGFKSKKIQPQEDSDELPIITNIDDPWQEESEEDEKIGVSINTAGKTTELVIVENGVKREEGVHTSHVQVEESAISKSSIGDSSPEVQVEAEICGQKWWHCLLLYSKQSKIRQPMVRCPHWRERCRERLQKKREVLRELGL